jgi:hypothetical protein
MKKWLNRRFPPIEVIAQGEFEEGGLYSISPKN